MNKIVQIAAKTHNGITRDHNEDNFIVGTVPSAESWIVPDIDVNVLPEGLVFSVADGMGGENAGEIASEIAVTSIKTYFQQHFEIDKNNNLESSLVFAHNNIKDACRANPDYIGMGTTAVVALLKNDKLSLSWVGDSRVYRYSIEGRITNHAHFVNGLESFLQMITQKV
ncbi:MAG: protein phosphatase 2C domain-containing protein [Saprospiraceae bacterium]|nr:protein phosphatase 2C domain-containing protein [Saprospiraceae bacterium]